MTPERCQQIARADPRKPRFPGWHWSPSFRERVHELWWKSRELRGVLLVLLFVGLIVLVVYGWLQVVWVSP